MASAGRPFGLRNFRETPAAGLAFACLLSAVAFGALVGSAVLLHPRSAAVGHNPSSDYQIMTWSLAWWPWAIRHGVDPTYTHLLWAPGGFSTLWMTTIPTASLLAVPITLTAGPLAAFNLLMILATVLATAAGYLLCRELTGRNAPSVLGGLIFGLSPYMLGHSLSQHLNLVLVFPLPLLVLLVVRHARGRTSSTRLVSGFAASLIVLLGASLELFVDFTVLAVVVFTIAIAAGGSQRRAFLRIASLVGTGYGICLPILLPIGLVALSQPHAPLRSSPSDYATDLLNILVPTSTLAIGAVHSTREVSRHFVGNIGERDGYLGLPLLVVSAAAVRLAWRRGAWILGAAMLAALLLSLGPYLTVAGRPIVHFPVSLASLPLLRDALPGRFSLFTSLAAACLCAIWLAAPHRRGAKPIVVVLLVASLVPNFWSGSAVPGAWAISNVVSWSTPHISRGFLTRGWSSRIKPGSNVLVLPTGDRSSASFWQAISGMRFTLAFPATPFVPPALAADPVVARLADDALPQLDGADVGGARLRAFLLSRDIRTVVVTSPARARWSRLVARATRSQPFALGDVQVYHLPRVLPPLSAEGALSETGAGGSHVAAWLRFDGYRARLLACVWTAARPLGVVAVLSTPAADAEGSADAINAQGKAAVAFTEWRAPRLLLRVASYTRSSWSVATLDQRSTPIWSASSGRDLERNDSRRVDRPVQSSPTAARGGPRPQRQLDGAPHTRRRRWALFRRRRRGAR